MVRMRLIPCWIVLLLALLPGIGYACLWDTDTLAMEKKRFPASSI